MRPPRGGGSFRGRGGRDSGGRGGGRHFGGGNRGGGRFGGGWPDEGPPNQVVGSFSLLLVYWQSIDTLLSYDEHKNVLIKFSALKINDRLLQFV